VDFPRSLWSRLRLLPVCNGEIEFGSALRPIGMLPWFPKTLDQSGGD
jgi:hypothetical protein